MALQGILDYLNRVASGCSHCWHWEDFNFEEAVKECRRGEKYICVQNIVCCKCVKRAYTASTDLAHTCGRVFDGHWTRQPEKPPSE